MQTWSEESEFTILTVKLKLELVLQIPKRKRKHKLEILSPPLGQRGGEHYAQKKEHNQYGNGTSMILKTNGK